MHPEFIGIDIYPEPKEPRKPGTQYLQLDFVFTPVLPWDDNSIDEIICFHVIEHMDRVEGVILLKRIWRLLKPGASAYIKCPDTRLFVRKYLEGDEAFFNRVYPKNNKRMWPGNTLLESLFYSMHDQRDYGHVKPYDLETLFDVAKEAGCKNVAEMLPDHEWMKKAYRDHETGIIITK